MADSIKSTDVPSVHGIVALNPDGTAIGTPVGGATSDNQTNGTQKTQIVDAGGEAATVTGGKLDVNATASLAGTALPISGATEGVGVAILDGSGNQITSFGGGTQYTEGDTDASITGTAAMVEGAANALAVMTQPLTDTQLRATAVPVSGTFWQATQPVSLASVPSHAVTNAGTFAVQVDGAALTSLQLIDDAIATTGSAITTKGVALSGTDGTNARVVKTDTSGELQVDVLTLPNVTIGSALPSGTNAIGKLAANSGVDIGDVDVTSLPALAAGTNTIGAVKSVPSDIDINGSNANHADKYYTNSGAVTDGIVWSPAAGKRWHVLTLYINVSAAATVTLEDDLAGGDVVRWKGELAANSGVVLTYDKEHPFCSGEDAADLIITTSAGNVYVQAVGYEI